MPLERYVIRLVVNDGFVNSVADTVSITTTNSPPVANAGLDQTALVTQAVTLDGSGSSDVDGNPLTFAWSFVSRPAESSASLAAPTSVRPTFVVDAPGTYVVQLVVNDGVVDSRPDTISITTTNSPPVANAGPDQTILVGASVTLDGSGSTDVDGNPITYAWSFTSVPAGSSAALSNPAAVRPAFVADKPGTYVAQLIVNDGTASSTPDTVTINTRNSVPIANAGPDRAAIAGQLVLLDGTGSSDPDGDPLTFRWSFASTPQGSTAILTGANSPGPSFIVDRTGTYVIQLIVNDGSIDSAPDSVTITTTNSTPTANAGPDQIGVSVGTAVALDGTQSIDPDGQPLTYRWSLISRPAGSGATLTGPTAAQPSFVPDLAGDYVAQLIVNDGFVDSVPDTVLVSANTAPVANAGPDQQVSLGASVQLDGSGSSDPDGGSLAFFWAFSSMPAGSVAQLQNQTTAAPSFVADVAGTFIIQLTVADSAGAAAIDTVTVTAFPESATPPVVTLNPNDATVLAGQSASFVAAADGNPVPAVQWQSSSDGDATFADIPGATSTTLSFVTTLSDDGRRFRAVFSNSAGVGVTTTAILTITVTSDVETVVVSDAVGVNGAPLLQPVSDQTVDAETPLQVTAVAVDPGDTVAFSLVNAPAGAIITATGVFSWTPTEPQSGASYPVVVRATDSGGLYVDGTFTVTVRPVVHADAEAVMVNDTALVNGAPLLQPVSDQTVDAETPLQVTAVAVDPGDTVVFSLVNAPAGAIITATGVFSWTPTEPQSGASYPVVVRATDSGGLYVDGTFTVTVRPVVHADAEAVMVNDTALVNGAPLLQPVSDQTVDAETPLQVTAVAVDPGDTVVFSLVNAPAGASITGATGVFSWTPTEPQSGASYPVVVRATDSGGLYVDGTFTVTVRPVVHADAEAVMVNDTALVNGAPLLQPVSDQTVDAETPLQVTAVAVDPGDTVVFSLVNAPAGASITGATGVFSWTPTEPQSGASYPVVVRATDSGGLYVDGTFTVTVRPVVHADAEAVMVNDTALVNGAPLLQPVSDQTVDAETPLQVTAVAVDPGDTVVFSLVSAPAGATITVTGVFSWTPTEPQSGASYPVVWYGQPTAAGCTSTAPSR